MSNLADGTSVHEWLPMPSGISITTHDSFSKDLLIQFDRKRSQLYKDSNIWSVKKNDVSPSTRSRPLSYSVGTSSDVEPTNSVSSRHSIAVINSTDNTMSTPLDDRTASTVTNANNVAEPAVINTNENQGNDEVRRRSTVAGDLIRKSSLYLRSRFKEQQNQPSLLNSWTLKRKKKMNGPARDIFKSHSIDMLQQHEQEQQQSPQQPPLQFSKVALNTTINISPQQTNPNTTNNANTSTSTAVIHPIVITQYPPKPLIYSPVEPLPEEDKVSSGRSTLRRAALHRLSLPLLKLTAAASARSPSSPPANIRRRRSDSDLLDPQSAITQAEPSIFKSIGRTWSKLISACSTMKSRSVRNEEQE